MADHVTISRNYLETLLRRAELHGSDESIKLPISYYNSLLVDANKFKCLKAALVAGGASEETLEILISSQNLSNPPSNGICETVAPNRNPTWKECATSFGAEAQQSTTTTQKSDDDNHARIAHAGDLSVPLTPTSIVECDSQKVANLHQRHRNYYEGSYGDRSLVIERIPDSASLHDVLKVVRGGMISNIYLRRRERLAHVSFVEPAAAQQFWAYSQQNRIIIKDKVVKVLWEDQQAYIPGHVINRIICDGATRNLVIRFPRSDLTAGTIRDDLEHIHRLEVVDVTFKDGHAWIQLNNIQLAITAKACMLSRREYKSLRIEYFPDECNQPLPTTKSQPKQSLPRKAGLKPHVVTVANRFDALSTDSCDSESDDFEMN